MLCRRFNKGAKMKRYTICLFKDGRNKILFTDDLLEALEFYKKYKDSK